MMFTNLLTVLQYCVLFYHYINASLHYYIKVTIRASENSRLATWEIDILQDFLTERPYYSAVITNILGKDITHKLYQVQEMLLSHPQYIRTLSNRNSIAYARHSIQGFSSSSTGGNVSGILHISPLSHKGYRSGMLHSTTFSSTDNSAGSQINGMYTL